MALGSKTLWIVDYTNLDPILDLAVTIGASDIAIRTSSDVGNALQACHDRGIRVHGWRWPSARRPNAMAEASAAAKLFDAGMDGYIVDPEGAPGQSYDWDQPDLEQLATDFCTAISAAAAGRPFGVTSHYRAKAVFPNLPWAEFFGLATYLLPQAYWRVSEGTVGSGDPAKNFAVAVAAWTAAGGSPAVIVPMAGELPQVTAGEVDAYIDCAENAPAAAGHFYLYDTGVSEDVWAAIAAA